MPTFGDHLRRLLGRPVAGDKPVASSPLDSNETADTDGSPDGRAEEGYRIARIRTEHARASGSHSLDLRNLGLTKLPGALGRLTGLQGLFLSHNKLAEVPEALGRLTRLQELDLSHNKLAQVPEALGRLTRLQTLDLSGNQLAEVPEALGRLTRLQALDLSGNRLSALPKSLRLLAALEKLYLHDNEALGLPAEVLGPESLDVAVRNREPAKPADILEYYFRTRGGRRPLNEAKLVLVGFGGVGKTSLAHRLVSDHFDPREAKTEGINITNWPVRLRGGETVRLNVWDFGGQEIMHATHQFFLTQRSLYVLVLAGRQGREDADAEYWLNMVASFAPDSPVIIVLNKIREHAFSINRGVLRGRFPNIREVVETDCDDRTGLDALDDLIRRETDALPHLRDQFPAAWFAIKDLLATMPDNYLGFLHSLGIALNYKDDPRLRDTHVLNPRWVTDGVYKILNHPKMAEQKGELRSGDLAAMLDPAAYPFERHNFLLQIMRKFELCFPFAEEDDRYLVPELLGKEQPAAAGEFDPGTCLNFEYHYPTLLPEGLLPRFVVRTHVLSADEPRWRYGVVLRLEDNRALVVADPVARCVRVAVAGPAAGRRRLLAVVRSDFERIHAGYKFQPQEMVPVPARPKVLVPYGELLVYERKGRANLEKVVEGEILELGVTELLDGVDVAGSRSPPAFTHRAPDAARVFVSYSHKDDLLRAELDTHLKLLERQKLVALWTDRRIAPGDDWKGAIDDNLERADLVLLLVSANFIKSDYCYDLEMTRALERDGEGSARVVPIIVRDVAWTSAPFAKLQALPIDGRAVAASGRSRLARDAAWTSVSNGIENILRSNPPKRSLPVDALTR